MYTYIYTLLGLLCPNQCIHINIQLYAVDYSLSPSFDAAHHYCTGGGPSFNTDSETKEPSRWSSSAHPGGSSSHQEQSQVSRVSLSCPFYHVLSILSYITTHPITPYTATLLSISRRQLGILASTLSLYLFSWSAGLLAIYGHVFPGSTRSIMEIVFAISYTVLGGFLFTVLCLNKKVGYVHYVRVSRPQSKELKLF